MKRLFQTALIAAATLSFCFATPLVASAHSSMKSTTKHTCPAGQHWVKGYKRNGTYVHGYCRK